MATQPVISYVSAPQANIYFGGILIDECYDIQYSYRESKEPIYGYLSQHFDAVLKGTVIITGALTINYKHDQYLYQVLKKAADPLGNLPESNKRPNTLKQYQSKYKTLLVQYSDALKLESELKKELAEKKDRLNGAMNAFNNDEDQLVTTIEDIEYEIEQLEGSLDQASLNVLKYDLQAMYEKDQALREAYNKMQKLVVGSGDLQAKMDLEVAQSDYIWAQKERDDLFTAYSTNPLFNQYYEMHKSLDDANSEYARFMNQNEHEGMIDIQLGEVERVEKQLAAIDLQKIRDEINKAKNDMETLTVTSKDLPVLIGGDTSKSLDSRRAEDVTTPTKGFTIEFNYNGSPHKRILECHLLGHGHVITQSGMPVKEQYTFIGKRME